MELKTSFLNIKDTKCAPYINNLRLPRNNGNPLRTT